jgi:beta-galactosidase
MHRAIILCAVLASGVMPAAAKTGISSTAQRRVGFDESWRFLKGEASGAQDPGFDDSKWRELDLPHDWAIEGPFDVKYDPQDGGLPFYGTGWYRKHFTVAAALNGRHLSIEFDGAMSNARVWLNGRELGGRPYGYIGFAFDLTPQLRYGDEDNVLAVRLDPEDNSSRWYPGAGIYRHVWLDITGPVYVGRWGTYITTPEVTDARATVSVKTQIQNQGDSTVKVVLQTAIQDAGGKEVAHTSNDASLAPGAITTVAVNPLRVSRPQRWDIDHPQLYQAVSTIRQDGRVADRYVTTFGIRTIEFDAQKGFLLNGRHVKIQGVCNHHDLGALGTAVSRRATERQLQIMKSMGVNGIRTSHNPPSPELLEFCDRLGLVVMDEAFDMWRIPKKRNGYSKYFDQWADTDLRDMLLRDRNHPSVVLWSIGNEIPEQRRADGWQIAKRLADICHKEDPTRPVTSAMNDPTDAIKNEFAAQLDIKGLNYKPNLYESVMRDHPQWILAGSETASTVSSRGVYHLPMEEKYGKSTDLQVTSYDIMAPPWATPPDPEFASQQKFPNVLGEFVWTGFDYLGEPTPYGSRQDWPSRSSYFGIVDLCGFPKDRYYLYKSVWTGEPVLHILPHWNWSGREGQPIPVMVYTNADEVELFLNNKSIGRRKLGIDTVELPVGPNVSPSRKYVSKYRLTWQVTYAPGTLRAVGYKNGKQIATDKVPTAGVPAKIVLSPDRAAIAADGEDLSFVTVKILDRDGNFCPLADNLVRFRIEGPGKIAAVDNGNAATTEPFQADYRKAFNGMALAIVRAERAKAGSIRLSASAEGLQPAEAVIHAARP